MNRLPFAEGATGTPFGKTLANHPGIEQSFEQMQAAIGGTLDSSLLEMVRLRVASNNGCDY
jgi:alkylhydroperoxidase family enzyme